MSAASHHLFVPPASLVLTVVCSAADAAAVTWHRGAGGVRRWFEEAWCSIFSRASGGVWRRHVLSHCPAHKQWTPQSDLRSTGKYSQPPAAHAYLAVVWACPAAEHPSSLSPTPRAQHQASVVHMHSPHLMHCCSFLAGIRTSGSQSGMCVCCSPADRKGCLGFWDV